MAAEHIGGIRMSEYQYELALSRVEDLMVQAFAPKMITAVVISEGFTDSPATVKTWRNAVQRRWAAEELEMRPARKDLWRTRLEAQYHALLEKAGHCKSEFAFAALHAEATKVAKVAIVLDGLTLPSIVAGDGKPDPTAMSPVEREREIADLLVKRQAALEACAAGKASN